MLLVTDEDFDDEEHSDSDNSTNQNDMNEISAIEITTSTTSASSTLQLQSNHEKQERRYSAKPPLLLCVKAQQLSGKSTAPLILHCNFVITLRNDLYDIQRRSCADPRGLRLYGIYVDDRRALSNRVRLLIGKGYEAFKPGWARVNINYFISDAEAAYIVKSAKHIATHGWKMLPLYVQNLHSGLHYQLKESALSLLHMLFYNQFQNSSSLGQV